MVEDHWNSHFCKTPALPHFSEMKAKVSLKITDTVNREGSLIVNQIMFKHTEV